MRTSAVLAAVLLSGCSLMNARRPDPPPYQERPNCHGTYGPPLADTFAAAGGLLSIGAGIFFATRPPEPDGSSTVPGGILIAASGVGVAAVFGTSAIIGYPRVSACQEAIAEWDKGEPERQRLAAELAERARLAAEEANRQRRNLVLEKAAELLRCPKEQVTITSLAFQEADPARQRWGWVDAEARGCSLAAWCGEAKDSGLICRYPGDFYIAAAQLAVETQCPENTIQPQMQQEFSKRTWSLERGESFQITWRLAACAREYTCSVTGGLAASVTCKVALSSQP
jgi:hypothetical protein